MEGGEQPEVESGQPEVKILVETYADETSAHCGPVLLRANGGWRRPVWVVITLTLVCLWFFHSGTTIHTFFKYQVTTKTELILARQQPYPAVTVCNKNAYNGPMISKFFTAMSAQQTWARENNFTNASLYGPLWLNAWERELKKSNNSDKKKAETVLQLFTEFMDKYGKIHQFTFDDFTMKSFVNWCQYGGEDCALKDIKVNSTPNWLYGECSTFVVKHNATQTGPRFGLDLALFIDQEQYSDLTPNAGVQVVVHPPGEMPFPDEEGVSVAPGNAAFVGVKMRRTKKLDGHYGDCFNKAKQNSVLDYFKRASVSSKYSLKACQKSCFQRALLTQCSCLDTRFPPYLLDPSTADADSCLSKYLSSYNFSKGLPTYFGCKDDLERKFNAYQLGCNKRCHVPCQEIKYETTVSYASWPSFSAMDETILALGFSESAQPTVAELRKDFLNVVVFFEDLNFEMTSESKTVELTGMLSDLGGNMGLYLGASVFTFCEFLQFVFDVINWCCRSSVQKVTNFSTTKDNKIRM